MTRVAILASCVLACSCGSGKSETESTIGAGSIMGDVEAGRLALQRYECGVCHEIPGVRGARGRVGPSLAGYGRNVHIAGKFPNTAPLLSAWIVNAPSLAPDTAMPALNVPEDDARNMAAYLASLD